MRSATDECFPWKNYKIRSTDDPWNDEATRNKIRQRQEVFARDQGRSRDWRVLKATTNKMIKERKQAYYHKECEKLKEEGSHSVPYRALKALSLAERPPTFDPGQIKPELTEQELADDMAEFFASISADFLPIELNALPTTFDREHIQVSVQAVNDRLIEMKKLKYSVSFIFQSC